MPKVGRQKAKKADAAKHKQEQTAARVAEFDKEYAARLAEYDKEHAGRVAEFDKEYAARVAEFDKEQDARTAKSRASRATKKMRDGGRVENGHDVTDARGSGAARTQRFKKNG